MSIIQQPDGRISAAAGKARTMHIPSNRMIALRRFLCYR
jgi:hypothetical protein